MSLTSIALYCLRAAGLAAFASAVYLLLCRLRRQKIIIKRLLTIAYLAALIQITVLRGGINWENVISGGRTARLIPFSTMLELLHGDLWDLIYNVVGNLIWFVPLGVLLRRRRGWMVLACGAALSACIEFSQYVLMTGVTDIDDLILNAVGAWLGWAICVVIRKK